MAEHRDVARLDDERLGAILASIGEHLEVETTPVLTPPAAAAPHATAVVTGGPGRPARSRRRYRLLAAAAAAVLVGAALSLTLPPVRQAVASWLGVGSTRVERTIDGSAPADLPPLEAGLVPVTAEEAERRLPQGFPDTARSVLGPPEQLFLPPEGGVLLVWAHGSTTLWAHQGAMPGDVLYRKLVGAGQQVRPVEDLGDAALLVSGRHVLVTPARRLAAGTVLLWTEDGVEYRLESDLAPEALVAVARSL